MYEVSTILYNKILPNVQRWMNRLVQDEYLQQVKRTVEREPLKRPKGETGYQLIASKVVDELDRTLVHNTNSRLSFTEDEKRCLTSFLDASETRRFTKTIRPGNIEDLQNYDLCSMFATIFWTHVVGTKRVVLIDVKEFDRIEKVAEDPRFIPLVSKAVRGIGKVGSAFLGSLITEEEHGRFRHRFTNIATMIALVRFSAKLSSFMSSCEPVFLEKLRWCGQPALPTVYEFSKIADELPSILKEIKRSPAIRDLEKTTGRKIP